jgi:dGTPase
VYADDDAVFGWLRQGSDPVEPARRCVEAQVMDISDDIAYSVHDVEDAVVSGRLDPALLVDPDAIALVEKQTRDWYLPDAGVGEVEAALLRLQTMPAWVSGFDGSRPTSWCPARRSPRSRCSRGSPPST